MYEYLQPDDYIEPPKETQENKAPDADKDNDDLDDLFNGLNPDDGLDIGLDDFWTSNIIGSHESICILTCAMFSHWIVLILSNNFINIIFFKLNKNNYIF